jgi:hypothetical protein
VKYLRNEFYGVLSNQEAQIKWHRAYDSWEKTFMKISHYFPKEFVLELLEGNAFHDSGVTKLIIDPHENSSLSIVLHDGYDASIEHIIVLTDIENLLIQTDFDSWLYCEILKVKRNRYSLEIQFPNDQHIYVEFSSLNYERRHGFPRREDC